MKATLLLAHAALAVSPVLPVFEYEADLFRPRSVSSPVVEGLELSRGRPASRSVVAAGVPGLMSLIGLTLVPLVTPRRAAWGSFALGLSMCVWLSLLLAYYGERRAWGAWLVLGLTLILAGVAARAIRKAA